MTTAALIQTMFRKAENSEWVRNNMERVAQSLLAGDISDDELLDEGCLLAEKAALALADRVLLNQWFGLERVKPVTYRRGEGTLTQKVTEYLIVERKNGEARSAKRRCDALGLHFAGLSDPSGMKVARKPVGKAAKPTKAVAGTKKAAWKPVSRPVPVANKTKKAQKRSR